MKLPSHFYAMVDPAGGHEPVELARDDARGRRANHATAAEGCAGARFPGRGARDRASCAASAARLSSSTIASISRFSPERDGVHLGQTDLPLDAARRIIGHDKMIGISTHNVEQARAAEDGGADYIGFGPMYPGGLRNNAAGQRPRRTSRGPRGSEDSDRRDRRDHRSDASPKLSPPAPMRSRSSPTCVNAPDIGAKVRSILALARN